MADKDNKSKLTYHVWDKDNNEYDIPDEVVQQRGMDNFAKDFEGGYITMFDDKKQKVDVPIEDVGEYRKQGYIWYDTSGNATPINEIGKKTSSTSEKKQTQYPQEVIDAYNSPDNKPGNFKDLSQLNDEYQRGELKKPGLISQALGMIPKVGAGNIGREEKIANVFSSMFGGGKQPQPSSQQQESQPIQQNAPTVEQAHPIAAKKVDGMTGAAPVQQVDAIYNKYVGKSDALSETMYDLMASGQAQNQEEAQQMAMGAMNRAAYNLAQRTTDEFVNKLGDTVADIEQAIDNGWYQHDVQDKLKNMASKLGIMNNVAVDENGNYITQTDGYDQFINGMVKPAMVESLVKKYGENYREQAEKLATRLYSHDEHVQDRLMNQDINDALSDVISKYTSTSVAKAIQTAEAASNAQMAKYNEQSKYVDAASPFAIGAIAEANKTRDPQKILGDLQKKFGKLYQNPQFLNDMSNAAFKVMQRYGLNGTLSGDPKQFKPMINAAIKSELDQLEVKGMIPKGSADYILKTGIENTIIGKVSRKIMQTDYQNWLEDIANQQYQPGFWERVGSGALTFAGDAWSYWLPGAAGGKVTKSMLAKAEGKLAGDLMAKGMEAKMANRAAKVLIGKSKEMALKSGAAHGAVTFGGQSAISKPIDEVYRTGQFDENGNVYNPSVAKILANTLEEVAKQSAVGAIMQGGTIANMVGKGRGLATNILADVGGKAVDSSIMTGQQMLGRMAQDPNFRPTGKDAAESFLESMANLTTIGLPGIMGKYARFKDAKEFNRKFDFNDQDIAELKRFGYNDLRDAFEKLGVNGYRIEESNVQLMGQLTDKYMKLMSDKSVPEVLKAKMMAVVEGKRPSSFSPVIDSIIVQPMDNNGEVYLETLNKDGGIIDRKEYSSLEEAQKAEKKLDFEKSLNITSEYEKVYHTDALQDRLNTVYEQARDKYAAGEQLNDEEKAAIYLHQNAGDIGDIMQKQQKGMELTEQEQQMVNSYRHFYDSAFDNSPIMKEYVRTFEDSQGVEHGMLRKALEGNGKSRTAEQQKLVEEYQKQLYNDIVLKREMNDTKEQMSRNFIEEQRDLPSVVSSDVPPTEPPTSPVGGETPSNTDGSTSTQPQSTVGTSSVTNDASHIDADISSTESKSDAYVMGQNAYKNGDTEALQAINHNDDVAKARLKRAFANDEAQMNLVVKSYDDGKDMDLFIAQRANYMTPVQKEAVRKYVEAQEAKKGVYDALQHADDGYGEALKEQLWPYQTEDGSIVPATLTTGQQVFLKKSNEYGGGFVVVPDENGTPTIKQVSSADIKEVGTPISFDDFVNQEVTEQKDSRIQQFFAQFDGSSLKPNDTVEVAMEAGDEPMQMTFAGYSEDGKIVLSDGNDNIALTKDEFNTWRQNALDSSIGAELDAEDAQRANDDAAKAEAAKKERYKKGIFGYAAGQPDYSDPMTDYKVAAEYLQESVGNDRKALFGNIAAEKKSLQTRINQLREHIAKNEEWLSINADLDPKNAESRTLANKQMDGQIADLQARFDKWNKIRSAVMTPEEATAIKEDRAKKITDVGVNEADIVPIEGREITVLTDEELKKQYPTMDEASDYITSERKRIYKIQSDEVQREIDGVDDVLNRYVNGEIDLEPEQIKELNTTKAQMVARQANLTESAKELKTQADKLKTLYRKENMEERTKLMEDMTPAELRAVKVENAIKNGNLSQLNTIYEEVRGATDFTDIEPNTLEEYVASNIGRYSLNYEGKEKGGAFSNGIQQETGLDRKDFNKLQILAKEGEGETVAEFVHGLYNDMPENLRQMGYNDQDIRNAFLNLIGSAESYSDLKNYTLNNKVYDAEQKMRALEDQEEAMRDAEGYTSERVDNQGNPINEDGSLKLEPIKSVDDLTDDDFLHPFRNVKLPTIPKKIDEAIGANGKPVIIKKNIFERNSVRHGDLPPEQSRQLFSSALYRTDLYGQTQKKKRPYNWVVINTKDEKGKNRTVLLEINPQKDNVEVVHWHFVDEKGLKKLKRQAEREDGQLLILPSDTEEVGALSDPTINLSSDGKDTNNSDNLQGKGEKFSERLRNAIAETVTEPTEAQKKAGNYKKGHLSFGGYDFTVETPKGATRSGKDENGKPWSVTMHDTYGYILGKIGVDGDHIDMFINDAADLDTFDGNVYVVDQVNPNTGEFDEHKVMYGYPSEEAATKAYLANYSKGWKGLGKVTGVPKATFDKWLETSNRKTKPFADYAMIKEDDNLPFEAQTNLDELPFDRNVKEVKPKDMTEAQQIAYKAVSTMLKKAGIPVKVVNNKDMERVAEEHDKLVSGGGISLMRTYHVSHASIDENKAKIIDHTKFAKGKGTVYGYTDGHEIVLNQDHLNPNTPIHEYQHIWRTAAKAKNPDLIAHGDKLIKKTEWFKNLQNDPNYKHLNDEQLCDEAFARLTGDEGEAILEQMAKDAIKENPLDTAKELSIINRLKKWLKQFWYWTLETFTKWKPDDIKKMTLKDIRNLVLRDLAQGVDPRKVLNGQISKDEAVSLRQQMADNAEPERILEHTEENWLNDFGKEGRVDTPIGSIKLGENQYKKAGREDRIKRFGLLKPTLERPDVILEKPALKEGAERQTKYLFIKSFKKADGTKILNYESITVKQGEDEVSISAHQIEPSKVVKELTESKVLWNRFRGDSNSLGENQGSALTPSANNPSGKDSVLNPHSDAKLSNSFDISNENSEKLSDKDKEYQFYANRYGTEPEFISQFDEAMQTGNVQLGHLAMANIRRAYRINHSDMKLSMFAKMFTSVKNELYSRYGNLDEMQKKYEEEVFAARNVMEAAQKRVEEEKAKKQKHLDELSLLSDEELDKRYMDAIGKNDEDTAREMLDESARRKGYGDVTSEYQGQGAWAAPSNPHYESDEARRSDIENSPDVNLEDMAMGYNLQPDDYFDNPRAYMNNTAHGLESSRIIKNALDALKRGEKNVKVKVYRAVPTSVKEGKLRNGDWVTPSKKYTQMHGENRLEGKYRLIEDEVPANQLWWDGNDANEFGFDDGKEYKYKNAKNNRKLNDLVTRDDKGNIIPPSLRFNSRKKDIRFMFAGEKGAAEADKAEEQTIRMDNLDVAKQMEKAKKDAKAIKMATGWEKGVDGKWRYEMPDAKIKDTIDVGGGNIVKRFEEDMLWTDSKLEDAVDAPKLFEAYPQLKNIKIHTDAVMNDMPSNGEYDYNTRTITIHADELKYLNSILNHEIQHAIQHIEGFATGGNTEQIEREFNAAKAEQKARNYAFELEEKAKEMGGEYNQSEVEKALVKDYEDLGMSDDLPDKETRIKGFNYFARGYADRSMDDAIKRFRLNESTRSDFDSYREYQKLAGEVEARNVQKRMGMSDEERRNSLASETEDVDRGDQIVMDGDGASYSIVKDPETIKKLDKEDTVKVYRAMQVGEDGKLYPPMAAKVKGKFVQPIELGKWEQADERPDLADDKGMFTLNKGNGKSLKAAYNPYLHTSRTPLNDQFSEAQNRPNIVTVEVEVPKSELTSGYKADKAKDAVGEVEWKAGIIQGQLTGKRKVILSRWDKPVRIVPDSEVADVIVNNMFKDKNIIMPTNVVTPSLRKELEKRGVPFVETDNRGRIVGGENDGVHYSKVYGKNAQSPIMEEKLKNHPDSLIKAGTYFSGGGLVEEGLKEIIDPVVAVEYDKKISGVYRNNFGQHIVTADVRDVDPKDLVKQIDGDVEYFHASPVCKNYSQAKANGTEVELDKETAKSTADFINAVKPRVVTIENVKGYRDSEAMKIITNVLDKNGYKWDADVYNAADYGGYTNRERLIVRAVKNGKLPAKPKKQPHKGGWLEAVEDIIPTLSEKTNGVAPWMDARLKADGIDWENVKKPLYVMGSAYANGKIPHAYGDEILPTLRTKSGDVIIMPGGKVLRADGRVLARVSGMDDDYKLPAAESLAHTIIGNGIPTQLTKAVIAPLLNKDNLSGRNILARLGKSLYKNHWNEEEQRKVADNVVNTANQLGGASATVYTSLDEVPDAYLSDVKNGATGWYDPSTHTVHVYLPNCADADEAQRTVFHEKIGHEGMEVLLDGEQGVRKFANFVYQSVGKKMRGKILDFANKYDPDWQNPDRINIGTQEYIAHLAEEGPRTAEDFSLWAKIKHYLIKALKKLGIRIPGLLNDKDLRYYLMKAGKALHVWDNMPKEKQEAMMAQASNVEIKDALSDEASKGKPRQKKGESAIQYMKRVMEWKRWKNAREDKDDPEPPMFYDFDKDAEGKKEWEKLNKDWRDAHGLKGDEMPQKPERKEGETDEDFFPRYKEWEKWKNAIVDKDNPMPDMFAFEKVKQDEARKNYEDWLARHELLEQQQADLDLYEGKIYPAETNPKAVDLEQQVMQDLAEVTSTDVSKEGASTTVKHAVIHRRKNMEEASADDAIYINDVKNRIEKMAESGAFDKLLSDYQGKPNKAEKLAEAIPYIIEAPRRLRDLANDLNATGAFDKGHIHIQPADVEAIQPFVKDLKKVTSDKHTELKNGKEVEVYDDPQAVTEVASKMAQAINGNHQGEEGFVPIDSTDILNEHVLPIVKQLVVPFGIDYKNLSPEMKSTIDSIRDWYNYTYDWLKDNNTLKEDTGYNADYVNHIWDKEKSDPKAYATFVENRQRTKSPNEKPRTISTLIEGLEVGLVPKTTDITKMMAYYSRSNIEAWANKTMLQEVSGLNVIERNEDGEIISSDPLLSSVAPFNLEQYKYFEIPGVGPVWVYNVSPKQVTVKNPITGKEKVLYSEASAGDRFGVVFDTYQSSPFWKFFDTTASSMKKLELGFSGFHAGALTEVYMVQNMVEHGPKKALANFMKYIFGDTAKNHELPCFANPEDFQEAATHLVKFGATNDYAAADVQNMFDNFRDAMMKVQEKLNNGGMVAKAGATASLPLKVATQMLSLINKGMDRALWDFLHDGLKLATYRMRAEKAKARAKAKGWTDEQLSKALDEDGQFVNDMFGGQHWDVLGASHRTLRYAGRVLLSPDWNASTTRHFLALTGFGSVWNEVTFENFKEYYKRLYHRDLTPEDEGRRSRQISALLCYGLGFMVFYEGIANGINAAFRALDEEKERKKAEEIRKTNPNYRSPYELAYPDGMKWYDYLMKGNSLGQQSKIFMGRYEDGTEMYIRHGKQFREVPEYLFNHKGELEFPGPMVQRMIGKANPMVRMTLDDINYLSDFQASHADQEIQRKYGKTIGLLYKDALYWAPFLIPSQENKEFKAVDFFFPSSKGFSPWKAQSYFKDFILSGDMEGVAMTYRSCERNGIDPEAQIKAAIGSVKALESAEMKDGVTSLQIASKRFDEAKSITEKKKMRQKMKKFLSQSEYKAFTQKEALDMVQSYLNGEDDLKEMQKADSKYLMKAKSEDVTEDWRIQNVWNGTMDAYQEYQRLKDIDIAKANAFKNSKTNKRLFAARKAISAAKKKMNKAKKQMDGQNDAAKMVEIRKTRKELLETLNGME